MITVGTMGASFVGEHPAVYMSDARVSLAIITALESQRGVVMVEPTEHPGMYRVAAQEQLFMAPFMLEFQIATVDISADSVKMLPVTVQMEIW